MYKIKFYQHATRLRGDVWLPAENLYGKTVTIISLGNEMRTGVYEYAAVIIDNRAYRLFEVQLEEIE